MGEVKQLLAAVQRGGLVKQQNWAPIQKRSNLVGGEGFIENTPGRRYFAGQAAYRQPNQGTFANRQCQFCVIPGHSIESCKKYFKTKQQCYTCGQLGHHSYECENGPKNHEQGNGTVRTKQLIQGN